MKPRINGIYPKYGLTPCYEIKQVGEESESILSAYALYWFLALA